MLACSQPRPRARSWRRSPAERVLVPRLDVEEDVRGDGLEQGQQRLVRDAPLAALVHGGEKDGRLGARL
eukprot:1062533-Pleurochrysis_carterae.AAC.1